MGEESRIHMFGEVSKHNQNKDCWLIIHGKVYDVSPFMEDHPGSGEILVAATGKDATGDFEDIGHSDSAKEMMDKYYIGEIDASTIPAKHQKIQSHSPSYNHNKSNDLMKKVLQFLLPLVILGIAFVTRHWTKTE